MLRAFLAALAAVALLAPATSSAAINVFIGSSTIPALSVNGTVLAGPMTGAGGLPGPVVTGTGVANLWIDTNGGTCTRQSTAGAYSDAAGCSTVDAAYTAAQAGDTVILKSGSYPMQSLTATPKGSGAQITFRGESKADVVLKGMDWATPSTASAKPDRMTLKDFTFADPTFSGGGTAKMVDVINTTSIVFDNVDVDRGYKIADGIDIAGGVSSLTWRNSSICCNMNQKLVMLDDFYSAPSCTGCTFDNVTVHDQVYDATSYAGEPPHAECWWVQDTTNLTIKNSRTYDCISTGDMNWGGSGSNVGLLIQNTVWDVAYDFAGGVDVVPGAAVGYRGSSTGKTVDGANTSGTGTIEYSIFNGSVVHNGWSSLTMRGNIFKNATCETNVTYVKNLSTTTACGTDNTVNANAFTSSNFVNSANQDWRPSSGAAAQVDKGTTASYPATDLLGVVRYIGAAPDAGPYEGY